LLHTEIKIKVFYKISNYKIFQLYKYTDMNTKYKAVKLCIKGGFKKCNTVS